MASSYFTVPVSQKKRKRDDAATGSSSKRHNVSGQDDTAKPRRRRERSEEISSNESEGSARSLEDVQDSESESDEEETAAERRLRLAERYLQNVKQEVQIPGGFDATDVDRDLIAERLKEDVAETKGKIYLHIGRELEWENADQSFFSADQNGITDLAAVLPYAYTVSKDGSIAKWKISNRADSEEEDKPTNLHHRAKPTFLRSYRGNRSKSDDGAYMGHTSAIVCCAASSDGKLLATGGLDKRIVVWDVASDGPKTLKPVKVFKHHRDSILSLSFRRGTNQLFSASADRTIKTWSLDNMVYIETLFGHQDHVVGIAGLPGEMCVSVGARDRTARLWKVVEESQLVFRGGGGGGSRRSRAPRDGQDNEDADALLAYDESSMDTVAVLDSETFVTGSDNGSIALWSVHRKKPVFTLPLAHGLEPRNATAQSYAEEHLDGKRRQGRAKPRWITALAALPLSDVVVSGSWDGCIRAWRVSPDKRRIEALGVVAADSSVPQTNGVTNGLTNGDHHAAPPTHGLAGYITALEVLERGERATDGVCVLAAVSKEHRLGKWKKLPGKNRAVVIEVRRSDLRGAAADGDKADEGGSGGEDD